MIGIPTKRTLWIIMGHIACLWSHRYAPVMSDLRRDNYFNDYWGAQFQWPTKPCIIAAQLLLEVPEIHFFGVCLIGSLKIGWFMSIFPIRHAQIGGIPQFQTHSDRAWVGTWCWRSWLCLSHSQQLVPWISEASNGRSCVLQPDPP